MADLQRKLKNLPQKPGIYLFKDDAGEVLYVGKAKNLKKRVTSYFQKRNHDPKTAALVLVITDLEYVIVSSELEALMLESNFIKKHWPRFNVILKDDKNYQFIKVDYETEIPQVYPVRKTTPPQSPPKIGGERRGRYFGPYTSALAVKNTLKLMKRVFHLCANKKVGTRPCFQYHLGRCPGVCIGHISSEAYRRNFKLVEQFLRNRQGQILQMLKGQMQGAAAARRFESAAYYRDLISAVQRLWEKQKIISPQKLSEDYLGLYQGDHTAIVKLFQIREGRLTGQETFELKTAGGERVEEVLESFMEQYYLEATDKPKRIISRINPPQRGKKLGLLKLAEENAREYFEKNHQTPQLLLVSLKSALGLPRLPRRIEGYDISNLQGTNPVGSMVVFEDAIPKKSDYRKFKINTKDTPDDVGMMKEMLERRFKTNWPLPDLIVIDGGKGQLNVALSIIRQLPSPVSQLPTIGLAKRLEEIYLPGQPNPVVLRLDSPVLQLLQRLRDEAHRFAVTFHGKRRGRAAVASRLDDLPGIGPATKKLLLKNFGSIAGIRSVSEDDLSKIVGPKKAALLKEQL